MPRALRAPCTLVRFFYDRIVIPPWLRMQGVIVGQHCSFVGCPIVNVAQGSTVELGDGVRLFSRVNSNPAGLPHPTMLATLTQESVISIGRDSAVSGASIVARVKVAIGSRVLIGAGACIWDTDFHPVDPYRRRQHQTRHAASAPVTIRDDVFIGARAIILKGVTIGSGAVIGAGSVVTKNVAEYQVAAGNPASIVGSVFSPYERTMDTP